MGDRTNAERQRRYIARLKARAVEGVTSAPDTAEVAALAQKLAQIAANQRQMMPVIDRTQRANALHGIRVADLASECIARIRRVCDHPARTDDFSRLSHQSRLRIAGMDGKILSHECREARPAIRRAR